MVDLGRPRTSNHGTSGERRSFLRRGRARNQVLFDNDIEIPAGQLVIMTGPSGSGKTTLLTLIGALRSLPSLARSKYSDISSGGCGAGVCVAMRRNVGFIFQMHHLFELAERLRKRQRWRCNSAAVRRSRCAVVARRCSSVLGSVIASTTNPRRSQADSAGRWPWRTPSSTGPSSILADQPTAALDRTPAGSGGSVQGVDHPGGMHRHHGHPRQPYP